MRLQRLEYRAYVLALTGALAALPTAPPVHGRSEDLQLAYYADRSRDTLAAALERLGNTARMARR
jgi:hypothetical protein